MSFLILYDGTNFLGDVFDKKLVFDNAYNLYMYIQHIESV